MVLGSFSICWMPYLVVVCTQSMRVYNPDSQVLYKAVFSLAMANSGINPVIYAWKNTGFRRAFLRLLRCQSPDTPEFERSFRNTPTNIATDRKLPLETISKREQPATLINQELQTTTICDKEGNKIIKREETGRVNDRMTNSIVNNNSVKSDRCRIIENIAYDERLLVDADRCHIIENLGFEDCLNINNLRMIDSNEKDSDEDSVATLPMSQEDTQSVNAKVKGHKCNV